MPLCNICREVVSEPCRTQEEALEGGCINPSRSKRMGALDPKIAQRVQGQMEGQYGMGSGSGSREH